MDPIQKYVFENLFDNCQINKENLTKALEVLDEINLKKFLTVLIKDNQETNDEDCTKEANCNQKLYLIADYHNRSKLDVVRGLKDSFKIGLKESKEAVDDYSFDCVFKFPIEEKWNIKVGEETKKYANNVFSLLGIPIVFIYE